jgi:hypothetical protein
MPASAPHYSCACLNSFHAGTPRPDATLKSTESVMLNSPRSIELGLERHYRAARNLAASVALLKLTSPRGPGAATASPAR